MMGFGFRPDTGAFLPSDIEDYGLSAEEFRVYARVQRMAGTDLPLEAAMDIPGMTEGEIKSVLTFLEMASIITADISPLDPSQWAPKETLGTIRKRAYRRSK